MLDDHPHLVTEPVEESSYLNINMAASEEGFQKQLEFKYDLFLKYLNSFIKDCAHSDNTQKILVPVLARLLTNYKHAYYKFTHSLIATGMGENSENFIIPNPTDDFNISKKQKYTRWAYKFFYKVSSVQSFFLKR